MEQTRASILRGQLLIDAHQPPVPGWIVIHGDRIIEVHEGEPRPSDGPFIGDKNSLICPGFIDAHIHLPQIESIGCPPHCPHRPHPPLPDNRHGDSGLLAWLDRVIYPAETAWAFQPNASRMAELAYSRMLQAGTLGFAGYLTSHFHCYIVTVRAGYHVPLRAIVGQSLMDRNAPPELLNQPIAKIARSQRARLAASVNPRFAIACSDEMLETARTRARPGTFIQTHLAETKAECHLVKQLFPNDASYTAVYDRHGLLTNSTLLAHCIHLSPPEWDLIAKRKCVVVHCPTANTFLSSGVFDLDQARAHGVRIALGSDVAAGPDVALPRVARAMIETAKFRAMLGGMLPGGMLNKSVYIPSPAEAWTMITRGNADALGWQDSGRIEPGASADLLVLQLPFELDDHLIGRMIYGWRDEWIAQRIVAGVAR